MVLKKHVKRSTPELSPRSAGPTWFGSPGHEPFCLVVIGDSTGAGIGSPPGEGVAEMVARRLSADTRRVGLHNLAVPGATVKRVRNVQAPATATLRPDAVLVCLGANDAIHLTRARVLRKELSQLTKDLSSLPGQPTVVLSGSPDLGLIPRVPGLLTGLVSARVARVNRVFAEVAEETGAEYLDFATLTEGVISRSAEFFSDDRFHLNGKGYRAVGTVVAARMSEIIGSPDGPVHGSRTI